MAAACALALSTTAAASPARAPLRLGEDPECRMPSGAAGALGHALVRYRVTESGAVDHVRAVYAIVRPDSARPAFVEALEGCVAAWRYRPARSGGLPVAESLLAAFHVFEEPPPQASRVALPGGRTIPARQLAEMRREKQALAMFLLGGPDFLRAGGVGYELRTDLPPPGAEQAAASIARARQAFEAAFPQAPAAPEGDRVVVHVFRHQEEFNQVVAFDELSETHVPLAGQYAPEDGIVYLSAGGKPPRLTARVVAHEVTHHLVHGRLYGDSRTPPFWVSEGTAAFIENLPAITAPRMDPVDLAALDRGLQTEQGYTWRADPDRYLMEMRGAAGSGGLVSSAELLADRSGAGAERPLLYAQSWLLVHFLMNGEGGRLREPFRAWLTGPDGGTDGAGLLEGIGLSAPELDARLDAWRAHLERPAATQPHRRSVR